MDGHCGEGEKCGERGGGEEVVSHGERPGLSGAATSIHRHAVTSGDHNRPVGRHRARHGDPQHGNALRIRSMNIKLALKIVAAIAFALVIAPLQAEEKSVGQKTAEVWDKTKATTKDVTRKAVGKTKQVANRVEAAVRAPDADAHKVPVKVNDKGVQMPNTLKAGKTAFVVTNTGKDRHDFEITGEGMEKSFWFNLAPNQTKTMQVELKPGSYQAACEIAEHVGKEATLKLTVK